MVLLVEEEPAISVLSQVKAQKMDCLEDDRVNGILVASPTGFENSTIKKVTDSSNVLIDRVTTAVLPTVLKDGVGIGVLAVVSAIDVIVRTDQVGKVLSLHLPVLGFSVPKVLAVLSPQTLQPMIGGILRLVAKVAVPSMVDRIRAIGILVEVGILFAGSARHVDVEDLQTMVFMVGSVDSGEVGARRS